MLIDVATPFLPVLLGYLPSLSSLEARAIINFFNRIVSSVVRATRFTLARRYARQGLFAQGIRQIEMTAAKKDLTNYEDALYGTLLLMNRNFSAAEMTFEKIAARLEGKDHPDKAYVRLYAEAHLQEMRGSLIAHNNTVEKAARIPCSDEIRRWLPLGKSGDLDNGRITH